MSHPFEVGKSYRNRAGEYTVQAIEGDWMKIRYASGGTLETRVTLQARIWENIQLERQVAQEEERLRLAREARRSARKQSTRAKRAQVKPKFAGFEASDFEPKSRGIAWSNREDLGRMLAHELRQRTKADFGSWIVPRKPEVEVGREEHYSRDSRETNAVFFVTAQEDGLTYGFRVGKPDAKVKANWPWSTLVALLADDDKVRRALRAVMKGQELTFDVYAMDVSYGRVGRITVQERGFLWEHETAEQEMSKKMSWADLVEYLQSTAADKRCDLRLRKRISGDEAVKAGAGIATQIATVFEALLPVYGASLGVES